MKRNKFNPTNPNDVARARKYFHSDSYTYFSSLDDINKIKVFSLVYVQTSGIKTRADSNGVFHSIITRHLMLVFGKKQRDKIKSEIAGFGIVIVARPKDWVGLIRYANFDKKEIKKLIEENK